MNLSGLLLFIVANTLGSLIPGPASILSIQVAMDKDRRKIVLSALGITSAGLFYAFISIIGLGAVITSSDIVFKLIRVAGALFLIYLGVSSLLAKNTSAEIAEQNSGSGNSFLRGLGVGMGNVNAILFFIAIFPQLFELDKFTVWDILICLLSLTVIIFICMMVYSLCGSILIRFLKTGKGFRIMNMILGVIFIFLGLMLFI